MEPCHYSINNVLLTETDQFRPNTNQQKWHLTIEIIAAWLAMRISLIFLAQNLNLIFDWNLFNIVCDRMFFSIEILKVKKFYYNCLKVVRWS